MKILPNCTISAQALQGKAELFLEKTGRNGQKD